MDSAGLKGRGGRDLRARFATALAATSASLNANGPCSIASLASGLSVPSPCSVGSAALTVAGTAAFSCACATNATKESVAAVPETIKHRAVLRAIMLSNLPSLEFKWCRRNRVNAPRQSNIAGGKKRTSI